jgi:hypothetical protein
VLIFGFFFWHGEALPGSRRAGYGPCLGGKHLKRR